MGDHKKLLSDEQRHRFNKQLEEDHQRIRSRFLDDEAAFEVILEQTSSKGLLPKVSSITLFCSRLDDGDRGWLEKCQYFFALDKAIIHNCRLVSNSSAMQYSRSRNLASPPACWSAASPPSSSRQSRAAYNSVTDEKMRSQNDGH